MINNVMVHITKPVQNGGNVRHKCPVSSIMLIAGKRALGPGERNLTVLQPTFTNNIIIPVQEKYIRDPNGL